MWFVLLTLIDWMAIYPVDSVIQPLNNWGLVFQKMDNAIHPIIHYLAESVLCFVDTNPLDSVIHTLNNLTGWRGI